MRLPSQHKLQQLSQAVSLRPSLHLSQLLLQVYLNPQLLEMRLLSPVHHLPPHPNQHTSPVPLPHRRLFHLHLRLRAVSLRLSPASNHLHSHRHCQAVSLHPSLHLSRTPNHLRYQAVSLHPSLHLSQAPNHLQLLPFLRRLHRQLNLREEEAHQRRLQPSLPSLQIQLLRRLRLNVRQLLILVFVVHAPALAIVFILLVPVTTSQVIFASRQSMVEAVQTPPH